MKAQQPAKSTQRGDLKPAESEYRSAMALRAARVGSLDLDVQSGALHASELLETLLGLSAGQFRGTFDAFLDCVHPEDRDYVAGSFQAVFRDRDDYSIEHRILRPDGVVCWISQKGQLQRSPAGVPLRVFGIVQDITDRRQAEESIRRSEALLADGERIAQWGSWQWDILTDAMNCSPGLLRLVGWPAHLPPLSLRILSQRVIHPDDVPAFRDKLNHCLRDAIAWELELRIIRQDDVGEIRVWQMRGEAVLDAYGRPIRITATNLDITDRKKTEQALRQARDQAESASRAKDQFIAILSHELRTPLTPVLALVSMLEGQQEHSSDLRADLQLIRRNIELEARLVDDLLDLTRISRGKVEMRPEAIDAHTCLRAAVETCRPDITARHLQVSPSLDAAEHQVWADSARLQQVFWNLLKNAIKFTPEHGTIFLRSKNHDGKIVLEIADTGIGIEPEVLPRLFTAFQQAEQTRTRRFGGLGLGLSIARSIVDLHKGRLTASSPGKGQGATFTVELPLASWPEPVQKSDLPGVPGSSATDNRTWEVLLVEDHPDTLSLLVRLLRRAGYSVTPADTVAAALGLAAQHRFDLLISDIALPDGTGLEIMRQTRQRYGLKGIAISGFGTDEDRRQSLDAGFEMHLTKPLDFESLEVALRRVLAAPAPS